MFAVFADSNFEVRALNGRGDTPQMAWEDMLTEYEIDESEIDMDTVQFYRFTEDVVEAESKVTWVDQNQFDSDD